MQGISISYFQPTDDIVVAGGLSEHGYILETGAQTYRQFPESSPVLQPEEQTLLGGNRFWEVALWSEWTHMDTRGKCVTPIPQVLFRTWE